MIIPNNPQDIIWQLYKDTKISKNYLSMHLGISRSTLARIEQGKTPRQAVYIRLVALYCLHMDENDALKHNTDKNTNEED